MAKCIESLLVAGDDAEIIIVNDGSTDKTAEIADAYAEKYPDIVRVIHKENGGHGTGVNEGVHRAQGLYFKVVDSDDWLEESALKELLKTIKTHISEDNLPDMYICNFVYYHVEDSTQYVSKYTSKINCGFVDWSKAKRFHYSHTMMMHALVYNTAKLREHYIELPAHTYYVDNFFAYAPLAYMLKAYYLNVDLYYYFIGRAGQSINIETAIDRYDQQLKVMAMMVNAHTYDELKALPKGLRNYMLHYLRAIMMNTLLFTCSRCSKERREDLKKMWKEIKAHDKRLYVKVRYENYPLSVAFMPWRMRGKVMRLAYEIIKRRVKLG